MKPGVYQIATDLFPSLRKYVVITLLIVQNRALVLVNILSPCFSNKVSVQVKQAHIRSLLTTWHLSNIAVCHFGNNLLATININSLLFRKYSTQVFRQGRCPKCGKGQCLKDFTADVRVKFEY